MVPGVNKIVHLCIWCRTLIGDVIQIELELECWFLRREENWSTGTQRKTFESKDENLQQTQLSSRMTRNPGIESMPNWWKASSTLCRLCSHVWNHAFLVDPCFFM